MNELLQSKQKELDEYKSSNLELKKSNKMLCEEIKQIRTFKEKAEKQISQLEEVLREKEGHIAMLQQIGLGGVMLVGFTLFVERQMYRAEQC